MLVLVSSGGFPRVRVRANIKPLEKPQEFTSMFPLTRASHSGVTPFVTTTAFSFLREFGNSGNSGPPQPHRNILTAPPPGSNPPTSNRQTHPTHRPAGARRRLLQGLGVGAADLRRRAIQPLLEALRQQIRGPRSRRAAAGILPLGVGVLPVFPRFPISTPKMVRNEGCSCLNILFWGRCKSECPFRRPKLLAN